MLALLVLIQVELLGRAVVTRAAFVRLFTSMCVHVVLQLVLCPKLAAYEGMIRL